MATPMSLSGTTVAQCYDSDQGTTGDETDGCSVQQFPFDEHFADLIGGGTDPSGQVIPKISYWAQCGVDEEGKITNSTIVNGTNIDYACADRDINDQSWENPFDVAKGHRGFMYGDFVMAMYAWSPNWKDNAAGKDNYNLYVRRSFDGGQSWTTYPGGTDFLPQDFDGEFLDTDALVADGSKHCEWYQPEIQTEYDSGEDPVCYQYDTGLFEQARNLSQLTGRQMTVLDPRYAPTDPSFLGDLTKEMITNEIVDTEALRYTDDAVNPSIFFATFEEGDTADIADGGEGMPMDMYYARAINFGDHYELGDELVDGIADVDPLDLLVGDEDTPYETFDKLECTSSHAAEASLKSSPGGTFFYATWQEWKETDTGFVYDSDAVVRRAMELNGDETEFDTSDLIYPLVTIPSKGCGGGGGGGGGAGGGGGGGDGDGDGGGTHGRRR